MNFFPDNIERNAVLDGVYRYWLERTWDKDKPAVAFVMLNPSTADAKTDDPTIRKCIGFARHWGYGGIVVANLFAFRATKFKDLQRALDPIGGTRNYGFLQRALDDYKTIVCAWGVHGSHLDQDRVFLQMAERAAATPRLRCLKLTAARHPTHPLYVSYDQPLISYG